MQLLVVRFTVWHLDAERECRFGRDGELGDVEVDDAGWWTANGDLAGECLSVPKTPSAQLKRLSGTRRSDRLTDWIFVVGQDRCPRLGAGAEADYRRS